MSQENVELVQRGYAAFDAGRQDEALLLLDPAIEWIAVPGLLPDAEDFVGHTGVRKWFSKMDDAWADLRFDPQELLDAGDQVVAVVAVRGRGKSSGIVAEAVMYQVWTARNGRLVRLESFVDRSQALEAVGLRQ
jgi:ketosteroid isomerase-like protein